MTKFRPNVQTGSFFGKLKTRDLRPRDQVMSHDMILYQVLKNNLRAFKIENFRSGEIKFNFMLFDLLKKRN